MTREEKYEKILMRIAALPVLINIDKDKKRVQEYKTELENIFKKLPVWASRRGTNNSDESSLDEILDELGTEIKK